MHQMNNNSVNIKGYKMLSMPSSKKKEKKKKTPTNLKADTIFVFKNWQRFYTLIAVTPRQDCKETGTSRH